MGKHPCEGIVGPNGAGKSTLVKLLLGLKQPWSGTIQMPHNLIMGFLPELPSLPRDLTVMEFLFDMAIAGGIPTSDSYKNIDILLIKLDLENYRDQKIGTLSRGTLQRIVLAQALIHGPNYVILDEPTAGLDPLSRKHMLKLIRHLKDMNIKVLMSTHILSDIKQVCQRVISIDNGTLISDIEISSLIQKGKYKVKTSDAKILLKYLDGTLISEHEIIIHTENPDIIMENLLKHHLPLWSLEPVEEDIYEVVSGE